MNSLFAVNDDIKDKDIYIWGTNKVSLLLMTVMLQNDMYVSGFISDVDNDIKIMNKKIITINSLEKLKDSIAIIVAGESNMSDAENLEKQGYEVFYDFNFSAYEGDGIFLRGK